MIYYGVGLGALLLMLVFLAIYQQMRAKQTANDKIKRLRKESPGVKDQPPGAAPFFVACSRGSNARFFRVYADAQARSMKLLAITLASGAVAALVVIAAVAKSVSGTQPASREVGTSSWSSSE